MSHHNSRRVFLGLRRGKGTFMGRNGSDRVAMLFDRVEEEFGGGTFLLSGAMTGRFETAFDSEPARFYEGIGISVKPIETRGQRVVVAYSLPGEDFYVRCLKPEEIEKYFPNRALQPGKVY